VFSTPSRSDVAQESAYEGSHDAKAAGNLPASPNATRSSMDSISLHWNTSPHCLRLYQQPIPCWLREAAFVLDSLLEHDTELDPRNLLHQHPTPRPRRIRKPDREQ